MFVSGKLSKPSLMLVGKARAYPRGQHLKRCSTWVGSSLNHKHLTKLEKLATNKHSSLLRKSVNYRQKGFITLAPNMIFFRSFQKKPTTRIIQNPEQKASTNPAPVLAPQRRINVGYMRRISTEWYRIRAQNTSSMCGVNALKA